MTWIGGIFSKVSMSEETLKEKVDIMSRAAYPTNQPSALVRPRSTYSILNDTFGYVLVWVSSPVEGILPEHVHPDCRGKQPLMIDGHLYDCKNTGPRSRLAESKVKETAAESLVRLLAELPGNLEQRVKRALTRLNGDYALAVSEADQLVISRNSLGTKPLYFAENSEFSAFASNRKPLWKIGLDGVRPLRAGMLAVLDRERVRASKVLLLRKPKVEIKEMAQAVHSYEQVLRSAVIKRLTVMNRVHKVGVLLSGGVDSCLIAKLVRDAASDLGIETIAYSVGLPDSPDVDFARRFSEESGIKHEVRALSIDEIENCIPKVIEVIEDADFVQVETGIGLYAAIDIASQNGIRVIFSGQGADELWGGYNWYPKVLGRDGPQELQRRMWDDFNRADTETLDRENKVAMAHDVELFFPYFDTAVADVAMSVASELKVMSEEDHLGKHPHRQLGIRMGISEKYANREKLAIQHGTGIHSVLDDIARRNGFEPGLVTSVGYRSDKITSTRLGSSARYGHRYTNKKLWQVPQHIQFFLHALAYRKGLLDRPVRDRAGYFLERTRLCPRF